MNNNLSLCALGVMSGTSLDGLDLALCRFSFVDNNWQYKIIKAETIDFPNTLRRNLTNACNMKASQYFTIENDFSIFTALAINQFLKGVSILPDIISSHGHTIFHQPDTGITVQMGNGATIAALTKITTISNFRNTDVALHGQGAPLVPIGDKLLFNKFDACLNLGGIANISFDINHIRTAFDISVCNMALNYLSLKMNFPYDLNGEISRSGIIIPELLQTLNNLDYYHAKPPKSLGREWFECHVLPLLDNSSTPIPNLLRTVTEHIASQIAHICSENWNTILVTGGGTKNTFLIERISDLAPTTLKIPDSDIIDFKEALIFAFLGTLRFFNIDNTLKEVTGASQNSCGGAIYYSSNK